MSPDLNLKRLLTELTPAEKAHQRGLVSQPYGKWADKSGKIVARTVGGDLEDVANEEPGKEDGPDTAPKPTGTSAKAAGKAPSNVPMPVDAAQKAGTSQDKPGGAEGQAPTNPATPNPHVPQRIAKTMGKPVTHRELKEMFADMDPKGLTDEFVIGEEPLVMGSMDMINFLRSEDMEDVQRQETLDDTARQYEDWQSNLDEMDLLRFEHARDMWTAGRHSKENANTTFNRLGNDENNKPLVHTKAPIERGMTFSPSDLKEFLEGIRVGQNIDMPPSGFSPVQRVARAFAWPTEHKSGVLMRLAPNKRGEIQGIHLSTTDLHQTKSGWNDEAEVIRPEGPKARCIGVTKIIFPNNRETEALSLYVIDLEERMDEDEPTKTHIKEAYSGKNSLFDTAMNTSVYDPPNAYNENRKKPTSAYNRVEKRRSMQEAYRQVSEMLIESKPAEEAHKLGLTSMGWAFWADETGEPVAKTIAGHLVQLDKTNVAHMDGLPEPNDKILTFTDKTQVPDELNGVPFAPWINAPETTKEWYNVDGIDKSIVEPEWPKKEFAPHVATPSKLYQHDTTKEPKPAKQYSLSKMFNSDSDKHSFLNFNKKQKEKDAAKKPSNSDKNYWDAGKKEYKPSLPMSPRKCSGCIIQEPDGRVWIVEPFNHFADYEHTFPKGGIEDGLTSQETAVKEAFEETGLKVRLKKYIGDYESTSGTTITRYYLAERVGGSPSEHGWETHAVKLVPKKDLKTFFNQKRDKTIATDIDSPYKNEQTMLHEAIMLTESAASDQAHSLGLTHDHYGYWMDSSGKIVARTVNGVLTKFQGAMPKSYDKIDSGENLFNYKKGNAQKAISAPANNKTIGPPSKFAQITQKNKEKQAAIDAHKQLQGKIDLTKQTELPKPWATQIPIPSKQAGKSAADKSYDKVYANIDADEQTGDADNILYKQDGGSTGSNPGGFYTGKDGIKRYVKFYGEDGQAQGEDLANKILTIMGITAPKSQTFKHQGKWAFASEVVPGKELKDTPLTQELAQKILDGFVGDVLVANADAIGAMPGASYHRNCLVMPDGTPIRIDQGGALLFRGLSGKKPPEWLSDIREWDGFRGPKNPGYAKVFEVSGLTLKDMAFMMEEKMLQFNEAVEKAGSYNTFVANLAPNMSGADRSIVAKMLETRYKKIEQKLAAL